MSNPTLYMQASFRLVNDWEHFPDRIPLARMRGLLHSLNRMWPFLPSPRTPLAITHIFLADKSSEPRNKGRTAPSPPSGPVSPQMPRIESIHRGGRTSGAVKDG